MDEEELNTQDDELKDIVVIDEDEFYDEQDEKEPEGAKEEQQESGDQPQASGPSAELLAARQEAAALREQLARQVPSYSAPQVDFAKREVELFDQQKALAIEYQSLLEGGKLTPEKHAEVEKKSRDIQVEINSVAVKKELQGRQASDSDHQLSLHYARLYGDVQQNPSANSYARSQYQMLVAQGEPDSPTTVDKAMNEARIKFGMVKGKPTAKDKDQLMGTSGGGSRKRQPDNRVKFDKATSIMATEMFLDATGDVETAKKLFAKKILLPARRKKLNR
jgi:hypothetical protein